MDWARLARMPGFLRAGLRRFICARDGDLCSLQAKSRGRAWLCKIRTAVLGFVEPRTFPATCESGTYCELLWQSSFIAQMGTSWRSTTCMRGHRFAAQLATSNASFLPVEPRRRLSRRPRQSKKCYRKYRREVAGDEGARDTTRQDAESPWTSRCPTGMLSRSSRHRPFRKSRWTRSKLRTRTAYYILAAQNASNRWNSPAR
jgi:hypothetical protein